MYVDIYLFRPCDQQKYLSDRIIYYLVTPMNLLIHTECQGFNWLEMCFQSL